MSLIVTQLLLNSASVDLYLNPGDGFKVQLDGQNNGTDVLTHVYRNIYFSDNSAFSFTGRNGAYIGFSKQRDIQNTEYSNSNGLYSYITGSLAVSAKPKILLSSGTVNFILNSNVSTYQNYIYGRFISDQISSSIFQLTIYANVKLHIVDYTFSKSAIVGNGVDSVDLILKVKDYNGCSNIDGGTVTANLVALGLSSSEGLVYNGCEADGKTAIFKKVGITTSVDVGDKVFTYSDFRAVDEDNNQNDPNDANTTFDDEDKKIDLILTVVTPVTPTVTIIQVSPNIVNNSGSSTVTFSVDKGGTYKVVSNGNGTCSSGAVISDWLAYSTGSTVSVSVSGMDLNEGANIIYACVRTDSGDIGNANTIITKDTVNPVISNFSVSPGSVTTRDLRASFSCNENGYHKARVNWYDSGYLTGTANVVNQFLYQMRAGICD